MMTPSPATSLFQRRLVLQATVMVAALLLGACANVVKVPTGDVRVGDRITMTLDSAWNEIKLPGSDAVQWTQDGLPLDVLQWWVGIRDGQLLAPAPSSQRPLTFRAGMTPHEVASLFEGLFARDGSTVKLDRLAPADFLGGKGLRFEFTVVRKADEVTISGVGWALVKDGQLHAMTYTAPRLGFFPAHLPKVEQVARAARLAG
jgi:hypothetical protein